MALPSDPACSLPKDDSEVVLSSFVRRLICVWCPPAAFPPAAFPASAEDTLDERVVRTTAILARWTFMTV